MPKLYEELAEWWPLMSAPDEYEEDSAYYGEQLAAACARPPRTVLELGSGGGNNASHLKHGFQLTLVEPSAGMLAVSRALNPECEIVRRDLCTAAVRAERSDLAGQLHCSHN